LISALKGAIAVRDRDASVDIDDRAHAIPTLVGEHDLHASQICEPRGSLLVPI
jgi:hypothetical protein